MQVQREATDGGLPEVDDGGGHRHCAESVPFRLPSIPSAGPRIIVCGEDHGLAAPLRQWSLGVAGKISRATCPEHRRPLVGVKMCDPRTAVVMPLVNWHRWLVMPSLPTAVSLDREERSARQRNGGLHFRGEKRRTPTAPTIISEGSRPNRRFRPFSTAFSHQVQCKRQLVRGSWSGSSTLENLAGVLLIRTRQSEKNSDILLTTTTCSGWNGQPPLLDCLWLSVRGMSRMQSPSNMGINSRLLDSART